MRLVKQISVLFNCPEIPLNFNVAIFRNIANFLVFVIIKGEEMESWVEKTAAFISMTRVLDFGFHPRVSFVN